MRKTSTELRRTPGISLPAGCESPNSAETHSPSPIGAGSTPGNDDRATPIVGSGETDNSQTTSNEQWRTDNIRHALAESQDGPVLSDECKNLHIRLISILTDISPNHELITQALIDDVYAQVVTLIGASQVTRTTKVQRAKGPKNQIGRGRKRRRYRYARTQDLFRKNPNLLARYIREGVPLL